MTESDPNGTQKLFDPEVVELMKVAKKLGLVVLPASKLEKWSKFSLELLDFATFKNPYAKKERRIPQSYEVSQRCSATAKLYRNVVDEIRLYNSSIEEASVSSDSLPKM